MTGHALADLRSAAAAKLAADLQRGVLDRAGVQVRDDTAPEQVGVQVSDSGTPEHLVQRATRVLGLDGKSYPMKPSTKQTMMVRRSHVVNLTNDGASVRAIARELGVSVGTVHSDLAYLRRQGRP